MRRLVLLHTSDIHGRADGLARVATLVARLRAEEDAPVLWLDAGDVEETAQRISNLTKGAGMHRLLWAAGVDAVAVGNGCVIKYGAAPLPEYERVTGRRQLAANLFQLDGAVPPGVEPATMLDADGIRVGVIGLSPGIELWKDMYRDVFGLDVVEEEPVVREHATGLRERGADVVVVLSHVGHKRDCALAEALGPGLVDVIVGAHSHTLLPEGEWADGVPIAHAGEYAQHLGRVDLGDEVRMSVVEVGEDVPPLPAVTAEIHAIEDELAEWLAEVVGELADPLELADDRECAAGRFMADVIRERLGAEVAVVTTGALFVASLPQGPLTRGVLYEACHSPGVSALAEMTGAQLRELVARGLDPDFAADTPRELRGTARGFVHLSGAAVCDGELLVGGGPVDPERRYRVAGRDWALEPYGGYAPAEWGLRVEYRDVDIMREVIEQHLAAHPEPVRATEPRWDGTALRAEPREQQQA